MFREDVSDLAAVYLESGKLKIGKFGEEVMGLKWFEDVKILR